MTDVRESKVKKETEAEAIVGTTSFIQENQGMITERTMKTLPVNKDETANATQMIIITAGLTR